MEIGAAARAGQPSAFSARRRIAIRACFSAIAVRDLSAALAAVDGAIALDGALGFETSDTFALRSRIWLALGDYVRAAQDRTRAAALDPHLDDGDRVRTAAQTLWERFQTDAVADQAWWSVPLVDGALRRVLADRRARLLRRRELLARPACELPCPSLCCYFAEDPWVYGVLIDAAKLSDLGGFLAGRRMEASTCLGSVPATECSFLSGEQIGPYVVEEAGQRLVYFPRRDERVRGALPRAARPKSRTFTDLAWDQPHATACRLLGELGCLVHDLGAPPGFTVCRRFLCLAAFVLLVLVEEGVVRREDLAGRPMDDLNEAAIRGLLEWDARIHRNGDLAALEEEMRNALGCAVEADRTQKHQEGRAALSAYCRRLKDWNARLGRERAAVRARVVGG